MSDVSQDLPTRPPRVPHAVPDRQLGYFSPVDGNGGIYYQMYAVWPPGCMVIPYPLGLQAFDTSNVDAALERIHLGQEHLATRGADQLCLGGVPVSALAGRRRMLDLLGGVSQETGLPASSDLEQSILALQHLGASRVVVAAKWDTELLTAVQRYLEAAGIEVVASVGEPHTVQQIAKIDAAGGARLALDLGDRALATTPSAEALFLAGGGWLSCAAVPVLEERYGVPVVTNPLATCWAAMQQWNVESPITGWGQLISGQGNDETGGTR